MYTNPVLLEFALGMFAYRLLARPAGAAGRTARCAMAALAAVLLIGLFVADGLNLFRQTDRLFRFGVPAFVLFVLLFKAFENTVLPKFLTFPGDISYSLYLVHPFVIRGINRLIHNIVDFSAVSLLLTVFLVLPLCVAVSWASWRIVECGFSGWLRKKIPYNPT